MDVVILNFLLVYPMLSEMLLLTVTWPCQTLQTVVKPVKCNVTLLAKQLNWEEHASLINTCISVKSVTLNAYVNRIAIL